MCVGGKPSSPFLLPGPPASLAHPSSLTSINSARGEGVYPLDCVLPPAPEDRGALIYSGRRFISSGSAGLGCGGLGSGFIAKCIIFPPLSKIFIYANLAREPAKFCMGNCPINSAASPAAGMVLPTAAGQPPPPEDPRRGASCSPGCVQRCWRSGLHT